MTTSASRGEFAERRKPARGDFCPDGALSSLPGDDRLIDDLKTGDRWTGEGQLGLGYVAGVTEWTTARRSTRPGLILSASPLGCAYTLEPISPQMSGLVKWLVEVESM